MAQEVLEQETMDREMKDRETKDQEPGRSEPGTLQLLSGNVMVLMPSKFQGQLISQVLSIGASYVGADGKIPSSTPVLATSKTMNISANNKYFYNLKTCTEIFPCTSSATIISSYFSY